MVSDVKNVYSVKSVSQVGMFSVGIGPIRLKLSGEAVGVVRWWVLRKKLVRCQKHVLREVGVIGGRVLCGYWSDQAETFREGGG